MKPNAEQEKALREKIKNQNVANNKDELRPVENYSIYDELKNATNQSNMEHQRFSPQRILFLLIGLIAIAAIGFYWI